MICLDSTFHIDFLNNNHQAIKFVQENTHSLCTTRLNYFETIIGINSKQKTNYIATAKKYFNELTIFELDETTALKATEIFWELKNKGKEIGKLDCIIAAIMLQNNVKTIVTKNTKHFALIKGIKIVSY